MAISDADLNKLTRLGVPANVRWDAVIALNLNGIHSERKVRNARERCAAYVTSKSTTWIPITNTPDFECGPLIAVYHHTHRSGHAEYRVYERALPVTARGLARALNVGGLPDAALTEQLIARADGVARDRNRPH